MDYLQRLKQLTVQQLRDGTPLLYMLHFSIYLDNFPYTLYKHLSLTCTFFFIHLIDILHFTTYISFLMHYISIFLFLSAHNKHTHFLTHAVCTCKTQITKTHTIKLNKKMNGERQSAMMICGRHLQQQHWKPSKGTQ